MEMERTAITSMILSLSNWQDKGVTDSRINRITGWKESYVSGERAAVQRPLVIQNITATKKTYPNRKKFRSKLFLIKIVSYLSYTSHR